MDRHQAKSTFQSNFTKSCNIHDHKTTKYNPEMSNKDFCNSKCEILWKSAERIGFVTFCIQINGKHKWNSTLLDILGGNAS